MIGDMLNNNKRRDVCTREDQVMYMGRKYRRDKKTRLLCVYLGIEEAFACSYVGGVLGGGVPPGVCNSPFRLGQKS